MVLITKLYFFKQVMTRRVSVNDMFIVLASDGVWEFMKSDEVS